LPRHDVKQAGSLHDGKYIASTAFTIALDESLDRS